MNLELEVPITSVVLAVELAGGESYEARNRGREGWTRGLDTGGLKQAALTR